ncbi:molybdopterin-synthase adenylyltransferase MoeB [bacterium]|nr:molybdopterin-synthase adenylyltransferase MoeB [bacterium]QQR56681.1 MAG: molybdopterin-synthase adenylyltransferase MoeB [Candidatus Melainabacteria bacterium]
MNSLSPEELIRYSRHILLPEINQAGQLKLKNARVLVAGAGGLGSPALMYLAAAGVGTIGVAEFDTIELSNLQRQVLFQTSQVGQSKLKAAAERLEQINSTINIKQHFGRIKAQNITSIISGYDVIVDGTDNFATRYLLNDACVLSGKPYIYGAIHRFEGQVSVFAPGGPCYRCLFPDPPKDDAIANCSEAGVLGVIAGIIGSFQALEAIKTILQLGTTLRGRLIVFDAMNFSQDELKIKRNSNCPVCGDNPSITSLKDENIMCPTQANSEMTAKELKSAIDAGRDLILLDVRTDAEVAMCQIPNSIHIPLQELPARMLELQDLKESNKELLIYCKSGMRSLSAQEFLNQNGFKNVLNLTGGIKSWAKDVDSSMHV